MNILLVEDEHITQILITKILDNLLNHNVSSVDNINDAFELFKKEKFDCVFMDVTIESYGDGILLAEKMKALIPSISIIGISASSLNEKPIYFDYFILKPILFSSIESLRILLNKIKEV